MPRLRIQALSTFVALVLSAGCSTGPGSPLSALSPTHPLIRPAQQAVAATPVPLPLPRELEKHVGPSYVVEPGDILLVQPASFDSPVRLPGDQPVLHDGTVNLGRYGRLMVAGKTVDQIEVQAKSLVESQTRDAGPITVRVVSRQSKVFYVLGEVNAPGSFPWSGRETVLDAILAAGGLNNQASHRKIVLSRPSTPDGCRIVLPICYNQIVQLGDTSTNYQIMAGDRIYVASKDFLEGICPSKKECGPCGGSHIPCSALECGQAIGDYWSTNNAAAPTYYPAITNVQVAPGVEIVSPRSPK